MGLRVYKPQEISSTNVTLVHFSKEEVYIFHQILKGFVTSHSPQTCYNSNLKGTERMAVTRHRRISSHKMTD